MSKPAVKKGRARSTEHGRGCDEVESVSSHRHHRQREPGGGVPSCSEDVKRARKEAGRLEREREGKKEREKERISDAGTDATQEHEEAEEPVSSYYFNLANLSSSSHARLIYTESSFQVPAPSSRNQNTICHLPFLLFSFSSLQPSRCHHFSQSTPRLTGSSLDKRQ